MGHYLLGSENLSDGDPSFSAVLASLYSQKQRPLCLCRTPGVEMYIAKVGSRFVLKRMPNSGGLHDPECDSYEPPAELSGLGQVMGAAIQEDIEAGITTLKLNFSLAKTGNRAPPQGTAKESDSVKTDGTKLTLRGTLHYLWEQAHFNKWMPGMAGKRNWAVVRKYLLQAAANKQAKGGSLTDILYIPEAFNLERKEEIVQRRLARMGKFATVEKGSRKLQLLIAEVKEFAPARYGQKIVVKHLPDYHFMLPDDLFTRIKKRFGEEIGLWDSVENARLIVIGTFGVNSSGVASIEEAALMVTNENWIPFEHLYDKTLIDGLITSNRRFIKGLRYNLPSGRPLASMILTDTRPAAVAMYIVPPDVANEYRQVVNELLDESQLSAWVWITENGSMPPLPASEGYSASTMRVGMRRSEDEELEMEEE
ncbi:hypothetical protein CEK28_00040 [Xenophilus sp. AP218F]|nr:hypothetical protein CEK28_00040 [Xenophilus sp. AP218F]